MQFGYNKNPNSIAFYYTMKSILLKNDITPSAGGNCALFGDNIFGSVFDTTIFKKMESFDTEEIKVK